MEDNSKSWYCFPQTAPWSFETVCHWPQDRADRCQHSYNWLECVWQETTPWNCKDSERIVTEQRQNTHGQISADLWGIEGSFWFGEWGIVASVDLFLLSETQNEWVSTIPKKYFREAQTIVFTIIHYSGQFTLSTQLIKPNYFVILPTNALPQFLKKLTSFILKCL